MNRIDAIFTRLAKDNAKALMPYLTMGDPDLKTSGKLLLAAQEAGASICELGFPFSDPIADGPVIQASMSYVLDQGLNVVDILQSVADVREQLEIGLVAMVSYSIVHRLGDEAFIADAVGAGIDGFIFPDLPLEESDKARDLVQKNGAILSFLIAPTTPPKRAEQIAAASSGFVYLLARAGITGEQASLPPDLTDRIEVLRQATDLPITVGFGVSTAQQVSDVVAAADAAIVGSALVRRIADVREQGSDAVVSHLGSFMQELATGLKR